LDLKGSSIESHEKNHERFNLSGVRFGSRAFQISGAVENEPSTLDSDSLNHQIAQIRHFEPQELGTSKHFKEVKSIILNLLENYWRRNECRI